MVIFYKLFFFGICYIDFLVEIKEYKENLFDSWFVFKIKRWVGEEK